MKIGNKTIQYSLYGKINAIKRFISDTSNLTLPSIEYQTDIIKGAGIMGEIDWPTLGQIGAMNFAAALKNITSDAVKLAIPKLQELEVRWVTDVFDTNNNRISTKAHKAYIKGAPKKLEFGKVEVNATSDSNIEWEVVYYNHIIDGVSIIEVDKFNNVLKIDGTDYMKQIRDAL